jgi:hypothetical protein
MNYVRRSALIANTVSHLSGAFVDGRHLAGAGAAVVVTLPAV